MAQRYKNKLAGQQHNRVFASKRSQVATSVSRGAHSKRLRGGPRELCAPFSPPEDWHEPSEDAEPADYRILVQSPGKGFRHILTPDDIRARLAQVPQGFLRNLHTVQLSRMTRKKQSFPCYGMQWGTTLYLYPMESSLTEVYSQPPGPSQRIEADMYGGRWVERRTGYWKLVWSEQSIRDFYLHNILIHELGHLVDDRNSRAVDRERYAEWFALEYGYKYFQQSRSQRQVVRRHRARHV